MEGEVWRPLVDKRNYSTHRWRAERHSAACRAPLAISRGGSAERKRRERAAASAYAQHCNNSRAKWTKS